jgi:tetratricopeptide (TPR) repeat protein
MRSLLRTIGLMAVLLTAASVHAQRIATIGKEVPIDIKVSLSGEDDKDKDKVYVFRSLRGGIALFYFWRSSNLPSVEQLSEIEQLNQKYRDQGVRFVSVTADNKDKADEVSREREFGFYRWRAIDGRLVSILLGAFSEPYVVLLDPRGRLVWRGVPDKHFEQRLQDLIEYTKPPIGDQQWLDRRFRKAERFFDQHEIGRAYSTARELFELTDEGQGVHGRAESLMARCEEAAGEWLREAIQAERDKDYEKAARIVAEIAVRFEDPEADEDDNRDHRGGSRDSRDEPIQRQAEVQIGRMNADLKLKGLIRDALENSKAELRNDQAANLEEDEYYRDAKRIYENVLEDYKDTPAAKEAKKRLRRIERDDGIQKKIAENRAAEEAFRWLDIADHYATAELYAEARDKYEAIIKKYPDTTARRRAEERLCELPEPEEKKDAGTDSDEAATARNP